MYNFKLFNTYSREDIAKELDPSTPFVKSAGMWGVHGICPFGNGNTALFVTYGRVQSDSEYDDGITSEGILRWQGQKQKGFSDPLHNKLLNHDENTNDILLFLRPNTSGPYFYLGKLKYLTHDLEREQPIYVQWKLIDLDVSASRDQFLAAGIEIEDIPDTEEGSRASELTLVKRPTASRGSHTGVQSKTYKSRAIDYEARDRNNRKIGLKGELLVLDQERARLIKAGKPDLAEKVEHVALTRGDSCGFDILSFNKDGSHIHIEVKTTAGPIGTAFFMSSAEKRFLMQNKDTSKLVRIFSINDLPHAYEISGTELEKDLSWEPISYRVKPI